MNPQLRTSSAHVFVDDLFAPSMSDADAHHLRKVLRLRGNEVVSVSDGVGGWRLCNLDGQSLVPVSDVQRVPPRRHRVTVAIVPAKGDRTDSAVEKLVEIGVDKIVVLEATEHSVVRWSREKASTNIARLSRVARAAAMQSRRVHLPVVSGPVEFSHLVSQPGVALADPDGAELPDDLHTIVIGPEGGFSDRERSLARTTVVLGPHILRADTAAVVAGTMMVALSNDSNDKTV